MKHTSFLKWWLIFCLISVGSVLIYLTGIFEQVNKADFTKISFLIYTLFILFSIKCGVRTKQLKADMSGWFVSDILVTLGMIGTVVGFIYMLSVSFGSIDVTQPQTMRVALSKMSTGMGTALYTTAAGLICSLLLKLQLFNLQRGIDHEKTTVP